MKNKIIIALTLLVLISCNQQPTLQRYFVDSKEKSDFISLDISPDILKLKSKNLEASSKLDDVLNTIKKVNILVLKKEDGKENFYKAEKQKVKQILKNTSYKQLFRANHKRGNISVKYMGEEDAIDEVIVFAAGNKEDAFVIFRLLGDNINPEKVMALAQDIQVDKDSNDVRKIEDFLRDLF